MPTPELDPALLKRAQRGDPRAFRCLYEHHVDRLYAFLRRMLRDEARAQDALQDVFLRVARALPGFRPEGPARFSTWLFTIARRVALTEIDRVAAHPMVATLPETHAPGAAPDLRLALVAAVETLPIPQRAVFVLFECAQLSYEEIAEVEGIDIGTVRSRLHRARGALQAALKEEPESATSSTQGDLHEQRIIRR